MTTQKEKVKKYLVSWLDPTETEYDELIEEVITDVESYIDEYVSYKYTPNVYRYSHMESEYHGKVYLAKIPVTEIEKVEVNGVEVTDYTLKRYAGELTLCSCSCEDEVEVYYKVGGIATEYPRALEAVAIELIIAKLNHFINNANGFKNTAVGEINMSYNFELTEQQKYVLDGFTI